MSKRGPATDLPARRAGLALACALTVVAGVTPALAEFALLRPSKDCTLVEDPAGALANGSGEALFAGRINTATRSIRRAVLAFDVAAAVPAGSTVTGARLWLVLSSTSAGPVPVRLHRVTADWGEGASVSGGGGGAPSLPGDATWLHRFFDGVFWTDQGGDFDPMPRAEVVVDQPGAYVLGSTPGMAADVQSWVDQPDLAFGWMLIGDETRPQTVKRFDSRESAEEANRPLLEVDYVPPCAPAPAGPGYWQRQCENLAGAGAADERSSRQSWTPVPGFAAWVVPCAQRHLEALGLPEVIACEAVLAPPPRDCRQRAERKLAVLLLNVCAGRLQTSCPVDASRDGCAAASVGVLLREIADLMGEGDCRAASGCGGSLD